MAIDKLFRKVIKESKPQGFIVPKTYAVSVKGFVATVYTIETIEENIAHKKKTSALAKTPPKQNVLYYLFVYISVSVSV